MRILRWLLYVVVVLVIATGALFVGARFHDGPWAIIPGGPLESGELITNSPTDWSFASDAQLIEMQLAYQSTSRTTGILVDRGRAFIPCGIGFPPGKRWHLRAEKDGHAFVRIDGKRYRIELARVTDPSELSRLESARRAKYGAIPGGSETVMWFFEMRPTA